MTTNTCIYIDYGVETIKRHTRAAYGCFVTKSVGAGLAAYRPIGYTPALSVTQKCRYICGLWRYISVICMPLETMHFVS